MNKGYSHLKLSEKSADLCTLSTHLGNIRPTRVPMGIKILGKIFDSRMAAVLSHCKRSCHNCNDILIDAPTLDEEADKKFGFILNGKKTFVGLQQIEWHGFLFTEHGASPSPKKVSALKSARRPVTYDGLNSFICTITFNSRFILWFSEHAQPLRILAKSADEFVWLSEHEDSFKYLKYALCTNTLNNHLINHRLISIFCDAGKNSTQKTHQEQWVEY